MKMSMRNQSSIDLRARNSNKLKVSGLTEAVFSYTAPVYDGEYVVTPKAYDEQRLETRGKTMVEDVIVEKVPFYEVSNEAGGMTCYIAEEAIKWE